MKASGDRSKGFCTVVSK